MYQGLSKSVIAPGGRVTTPDHLVRALKRCLALLLVWEQRLKDRDTLEGMSQGRLRDIGLTRGQAMREARKPFWQG